MQLKWDMCHMAFPSPPQTICWLVLDKKGDVKKCCSCIIGNWCFPLIIWKKEQRCCNGQGDRVFMSLKRRVCAQCKGASKGPKTTKTWRPLKNRNTIMTSLWFSPTPVTSCRIREHTISLRFLGIILRVLRLEVSVYIVYITNKFQTTFRGRGSKIR